MSRGALHLSALLALTNGCFVIGGFDFDVEPVEGSSAGGHGSGASGASGGGDAGGDGGSETCPVTPGESCYEGPRGTQDVGLCTGGTWDCDGSDAVCAGQVLPKVELCTSDDDENCDTYDVCAGQTAWYLRSADVQVQRGRHVGADADGNVYLAGDFEGDLTILDSTWVTALGARDLFLLKVDPTGLSVEWVLSFGSDIDPTNSSRETATDVVAHPDGGAVLVGRIQGPEDAGGTGVDPMGPEGLFVVRVGADGAVLWADAYRSSSTFTEPAAAVTDSGEIVLAGGFLGELAFDGFTLTNTGPNEDIFVARLGADGETLDAEQFGGSSGEWARGVAVAADGRIAIAGLHDGQLAFGNPTAPLFSDGGIDAFVAVLDAQLKPVFAKSWGDNAAQSATDVAFAPGGSLVFAGFFAGTVDFETGETWVDAGMAHACFARLDVGYAADLAHCFLTTGKPSNAWSVAVDAGGHIVVSGDYLDQLEASEPPEGFGQQDAFVSKFAPDGARLWTKLFGGTAPDVETRVAVDRLGNVLIAATATGPMDLGTETIPGGDEDALVVKLRP